MTRGLQVAGLGYFGTSDPDSDMGRTEILQCSSVSCAVTFYRRFRTIKVHLKDPPARL